MDGATTGHVEGAEGAAHWSDCDNEGRSSDGSLLDEHDDEDSARARALAIEPLLGACLATLPTRELGAVAPAVARAWRAAAGLDATWLPRCAARWATKAAAFRLTAARRARLAAAARFAGWKEEYRRHEADGARGAITEGELGELWFTFTFRLQARATLVTDGGRGFRFAPGGRTTGHPSGRPFPWRLDADGVGLQWGPAANMFPKGRVHRLPDWSWAVTNPNVVLSALDDAARGAARAALARRAGGGGETVDVGDVAWRACPQLFETQDEDEDETYDLRFYEQVID